MFAKRTIFFEKDWVFSKGKIEPTLLSRLSSEREKKPTNYHCRKIR
jgi:hypothetical protein